MNPFSTLIGLSSDFTIMTRELREGLESYWHAVHDVLDGSGISVTAPDESVYALSKNLFSLLFLYSYYRCDIPSERRILYATINQCLRGMVTGCDNLLDDEYKITIDTSLPQEATTFRSVLDIMVSDRVLFSTLSQYAEQTGCSRVLVTRAVNATLGTLAQSGAQEAAEEGGITERISPDAVLHQIHHLKTGLLFQSTWAVPALFEALTPQMEQTRQALYDIGIGCQLLDDLVDLYTDIRENRHNYVASWLAWNQHDAWAVAQEFAHDTSLDPEQFYRRESSWAPMLKQQAKARVEQGLSQLFLDRHQMLCRPAAALIADRIGVSF